MVRVQVEVDSDRRDRWDEYVESTPEFNTRADLIRHAVERFISDGSNSGSGTNNADVEELLQRQDAIYSEIQDTERQMNKLREENIREEEMEQIVAYVTEEAIKEMFQQQFEQQVRMGLLAPHMLGGESEDE